MMAALLASAHMLADVTEDDLDLRDLKDTCETAMLVYTVYSSLSHPNNTVIHSYSRQLNDWANSV